MLLQRNHGNIGEATRILPRKQKISDSYDKPELEQSPELRARLPGAKARRLYMTWLRRVTRDKVTRMLIPQRDLDGSVKDFIAEQGPGFKINE